METRGEVSCPVRTANAWSVETVLWTPGVWTVGSFNLSFARWPVLTVCFCFPLRLFVGYTLAMARLWGPFSPSSGGSPAPPCRFCHFLSVRDRPPLFSLRVTHTLAPTPALLCHLCSVQWPAHTLQAAARLQSVLPAHSFFLNLYLQYQ